MGEKSTADEVSLSDIPDAGSGLASDIIRLKSGDKVRFHVLSERYLRFGQFFNDRLKRSLNVPWGTLLEGVKVRTRYAAVVWLIAEKKQAVVVLSAQTAAKLKAIREENDDSLDGVDITLTRVGSGITDTRYDLIGSPTKYRGEAKGAELINLLALFPIASSQQVADATGAVPVEAVEEEVPF